MLIMSTRPFHKIHFRLALCVGGLLTSLLPGHAAPAAGVASIQMIAFAYNGSGTELNITNKQGAVITKKPITLPIHQCSAPLSVSSRDLVFTFVQDGEKKDAAKSIPLSLPATGRDFILVFLPLPAGQEPHYRVHAVELPGEKFKGGSFAFLNYSNAEIACVMDKEKSVVAPGKAGIMSPGANQGMILAACYEKAEGKWSERPFFSARVPIQRTLRTLVLMSRDPRNGRLGFRSVGDYVER